jgi:hypothetical protein
VLTQRVFDLAGVAQTLYGILRRERERERDNKPSYHLLEKEMEVSRISVDNAEAETVVSS